MRRRVVPTSRLLARLREEAQDAGFDHVRELSMGMSNDFEIAIAEGASIVRVRHGHFRAAGDELKGI